MGRISNGCLQDIVELDGQYYFVTSNFERVFERGYNTIVKTCDERGYISYIDCLVCEVKHKRTFDAVEKGHREIVSNFAKFIADYKAKQEEEKKKREEEQEKAHSTINKMFDTFHSTFDTFHSTFATSYGRAYSDEQITTISDLMNAAIRGSWAHNPEED